MRSTTAATLERGRIAIMRVSPAIRGISAAAAPAIAPSMWITTSAACSSPVPSSSSVRCASAVPPAAFSAMASCFANALSGDSAMIRRASTRHRS
jgi:hypothetical protein